MAEPVVIPILLGTVRDRRESERVAKLIHQKVMKWPNVRTRLIDVRSLELPMTNEGTALRALNPEYQEAIQAADAIIIVSPEYNHSFPGSLKRALDCLFEEWRHKAVGVVGVSNGMFGGVRMVEALLSVFKTIGLVPIKPDLYVTNVTHAFDERGSLTDPGFEKAFTTFMTELVWMAETLRQGRSRN